MCEKLISVDRGRLLARAKEWLERNNHVPIKCPNRECLSLGEISISHTGSFVTTLNSEPPQLKSQNPGHKFEIHDVCQRCIICGDRQKKVDVFFNTNQEIEQHNVHY